MFQRNLDGSVLIGVHELSRYLLAEQVKEYSDQDGTKWYVPLKVDGSTRAPLTTQGIVRDPVLVLRLQHKLREFGAEADPDIQLLGYASIEEAREALDMYRAQRKLERP